MQYTKEQISQAMELRPTLWIQKYRIKTETGTPVDFTDHPFLWDIYNDQNPKQVILKAAQIGLTTLQIIKSFWVAMKKRLDIIYTLPTESDVQEFAGGKVNRIVAHNPILQQWTKDKDTVEQKAVGDNLIYYRGTWTKKAAIMVSSDLNIYDEVDASKQDVIEQYATRLQHSGFKWEWYFSHPSAEGTGVDRFWQRSDQKHWFIRCRACDSEQYLSWPASINVQTETFVCKSCGGALADSDRRTGRWVAKYADREFSGYWIPLLICPWVSAADILDYYRNKSEEYFYNKVLGLPYVGGGNKLSQPLLMQNLTEELLTPDVNDRVVIGIDTGKQLHYVCGTSRGLFFYGETAATTGVAYHTEGPDYSEIYALMERWPRAIAVVDQGGDLIGSRKLREAYPGRVFLCSYGSDRKTQELVRWGAKDEHGTAIADRNRMIQLVVDEFTDKRIPLQGTEADWYDYWLHWNELTRVKVFDDTTGELKRKEWRRREGSADHWAHATVYFRVGISRFGSQGAQLHTQEVKAAPITVGEPIPIDLQHLYKKKGDWRA